MISIGGRWGAGTACLPVQLAYQPRYALHMTNQKSLQASGFGIITWKTERQHLPPIGSELYQPILEQLYLLRSENAVWV